jgi:hypothetical protein
MTEPDYIAAIADRDRFIMQLSERLAACAEVLGNRAERKKGKPMLPTIEDYERIVKQVYPDAFLLIGDSWHPAWSICNGTRTEHGNVKIPGVGWHETAEAAWRKAAEVVQHKGDA